MKGDNNEGVKNSDGGAKREKNMRGVIDKSASKSDNKDDANSWDRHDFGVGGRRGQSRKTLKGRE